MDLTIEIAAEDDVAYVRLREGQRARTIDKDPFIIDVDADGVPLGIEILGLSNANVGAMVAALRDVYPAMVRSAA